MARPQKDMMLRRTVRLDVRLTPDEERTLRELSQERGLTVSDFIGQAALAVKPRHVKATPQRAAMIRGLSELGKLGSNLNQIARAMNRQTAAGQRLDVPEAVVTGALYGVETLSRHLLDELSDGH